MTIKKARLLPIRDAVELYFILYKYVQFAREEKEVIGFVKKIQEKISPEDYLKCVCLLSGTLESEIEKKDYLDALVIFMDGLAMNKILTLCDWIEGML